jgi:hypothetical protein
MFFRSGRSDTEASSSILSNDFSGSESSNRRYLYGTFHGGDIRDHLAADGLEYIISRVKRNNIGMTIDSLPRTAA